MNSMNPEEPPRPKGHQVLVDRRGSLLAFKTKHRGHGISSSLSNESAAQKLHRLIDDIAPDIEETKDVIEHYLPYIELIESEQMLVELVNDEKQNRHFDGGWSEIIQEARNLQILNGEQLRLCDEVRNLRNALFHEVHDLNAENRHKITKFTNIVRELCATPRELAIEMKALTDLGEKDVAQAKPVLKKISPIACLVEIEQALRKVLNHITNRTRSATRRSDEQSRHPDNGDAVRAILIQKGNVYNALMKLGYMKDLKEAVNLRNKILHPRGDTNKKESDAETIRRSWRASQGLFKLIRINKCLERIEQRLHSIHSPSEKLGLSLNYLNLRRLCKLSRDNDQTRLWLKMAGVTRAKLKSLENLANKAFNQKLTELNGETLGELQEILRELENALPFKDLAPTANPLPKSKQLSLIEKEARTSSKKPKKNHRAV